MEHGHLELGPRLLPRILEVPFLVEHLNEDAHDGARELSHGAHGRIFHSVHATMDEEKTNKNTN